jgi:hypothetical protein
MSKVGITCACGRLRASTKVTYPGFDEPNFLCDACYVLHCYTENVPHPEVGLLLSYKEALDVEAYYLRLHEEGKIIAPIAPPPSRKRGRKAEVLYHVQMRPGISLKELAELMGYASVIPLRKHTTRMIKDEALELRVERRGNRRVFRYYSLV